MVTIQRTFGLPADALAAFENEVPASQRDAVVAGLLRAWLAEKQRHKLRHDVIEGCKDMAELYLEVEKEFHHSKRKCTMPSITNRRRGDVVRVRLDPVEGS